MYHILHCWAPSSTRHCTNFVDRLIDNASGLGRLLPPPTAVKSWVRLRSRTCNNEQHTNCFCPVTGRLVGWLGFDAIFSTRASLAYRASENCRLDKRLITKIQLGIKTKRAPQQLHVKHATQYDTINQWPVVFNRGSAELKGSTSVSQGFHQWPEKSIQNNNRNRKVTSTIGCSCHDFFLISATITVLHIHVYQWVFFRC